MAEDKLISIAETKKLLKIGQKELNKLRATGQLEQIEMPRSISNDRGKPPAGFKLDQVQRVKADLGRLKTETLTTRQTIRALGLKPPEGQARLAYLIQRGDIAPVTTAVVGHRGSGRKQSVFDRDEVAKLKQIVRQEAKLQKENAVLAAQGYGRECSCSLEALAFRRLVEAAELAEQKGIKLSRRAIASALILQHSPADLVGIALDRKPRRKAI